MSDVNETKKLLEFKGTLESRLMEAEQEVMDIKKALEQIDGIIVTTGFRTFSTPSTSPSVPAPKLEPKPDPTPKPEEEQAVYESAPEPDEPILAPAEGEAEISVTGKDGTVLGDLLVEGNTLTFTPSDVFEFTTDIPPFQSFLVERVLDNMKRTDQERASNGELEPQDILEYSVETDGDKITELKIVNYGGERRLRELNSSLRWTLDKMYDKLREG